jgi:quercetin dioxygenase-like cupin family protein
MSFDPLGYVLTPNDGHHVWFLDTRMSVKAGGEQTDGAFTFLEWAAPAGFAPPRHVHDREHEAFYLLDGEIAVDCGDRRWTAGPGDFVFLPRGIAHSLLTAASPLPLDGDPMTSSHTSTADRSPVPAAASNP